LTRGPGWSGSSGGSSAYKPIPQSIRNKMQPPGHNKLCNYCLLNLAKAIDHVKA
jgi:hypothetical protein